MSEAPVTPRPPVALGCTLALAAVGFVAFIVVLAVVFLESGSDDGQVTLDPAGAYPPGTMTRVPARGFYLVRLPDGRAVALADLDAANRAASTKCRVQQVGTSDPLLPTLLAAHGSRMNPLVLGSSVLLRETCNGALYDISGLRIDGDGPNLDRFAVTVDAAGRVVVATGKRTCTERSGPVLFSPAGCP